MRETNRKVKSPARAPKMCQRSCEPKKSSSRHGLFRARLAAAVFWNDNILDKNSYITDYRPVSAILQEERPSDNPADNCESSIDRCDRRDPFIAHGFHQSVID